MELKLHLNTQTLTATGTAVADMTDAVTVLMDQDTDSVLNDTVLIAATVYIDSDNECITDSHAFCDEDTGTESDYKSGTTTRTTRTTRVSRPRLRPTQPFARNSKSVGDGAGLDSDVDGRDDELSVLPLGGRQSVFLYESALTRTL